jgi:DsbC/DsbD-like thiol-disulfide interchange protein/cytochrome c biogenesis protein CcdA
MEQIQRSVYIMENRTRRQKYYPSAVKRPNAACVFIQHSSFIIHHSLEYTPLPPPLTLHMAKPYLRPSHPCVTRHRMLHLTMRVLKYLLLLLLTALTAVSHAQTFQGQQLVTPRLIADADAIVPGQPITIGLQLQTVPGWHTYWQYPGDAGLATNIKWTLPPGFTAGSIQWPLPELTTLPGDIATYDYPGDVLLPVTIQVPANLQPGQIVQINAHASWLVCRELCLPGKADISISLPVAANAAASHPANEALFKAALARVPLPGRPSFIASWSTQDKNLVLTLLGLGPKASFDFFPIPGDVQIGHPQITLPRTVKIPLIDAASTAKSIDGVVVLKSGTTQQIWQLSHTGGGTSQTISGAGPSASTSSSGLLYWLGLGFLGGLILNVMPCVLPVIALKIFGFIKQAGESPRRILALGFTFVAGIFAWFLFLAGLIVSFKLAGHQLNWAFQFQHPAFVGIMVVILLLFSLNLLGVFEIVLPSRLQAKVYDAAGQEGYAGTFWHGVFATLMATPCTAPFLGPALGFALAQPAPTVFAMFGSIAAGMSAPYAILAVKPAWLRYLPKPGIWMVRVKQALGVLLMGTVCWLGWVLFNQFENRPKPFPPQLAEALSQHKIVFVDFTADWCVNCKVNEHLVLDSTQVQDAFRQHGVILLKADWTNGDEDITALLRKFGRAGVPCYVIYSPSGNLTVLPEVITPDIVLNALNQAQS